MKLAILQMADTPQIESSAVMLRTAGYEVKVCSDDVRTALVRAGCDTVLGVKQMISCGYDELDPSVKEATLSEMDTCDLFVEIKVRNVHKIWKRWPRLECKTVWWRVNGARPEHVIKPDGKGGMEDCGNEMDPPCPVISADLWYGIPEYNQHNRNYVFWPPYPRQADYDPSRRDGRTTYDSPFCLCHGIYGWGFKHVIPACIERGVRIFGVNAPEGILHHSKVADLTASGLCMVHIKGVDCPGWALYEAMLSGCPVVLPRLCIERMRGHELFEDGITCLAFGLPGDEHGRGDIDFDLCMREIDDHTVRLRDPSENRRIGLAGRERLLGLMWSVERNGDDFKSYMERVIS